MRYLFTLILLFTFLSFGQDQIVLKSFVKSEGLVQLRWAPTNAEIFQNGLKNGYTIKRIGTEGEKTITIAPLKDRKTELLQLDDSLASEMIDFAEGVREANDENILKQSYAMLTLASSANKTISKIVGLYYEDNNLSSGNYTYTVQLNKSDVKSNDITVNSKKLDSNPSCSELSGYSRIDLKEAYMEWEAKELNPFYGGYFILKSVDKKNFSKINQTPFFHFTSQYEKDKTVINYVDTTVQEGMTYYYKVQPINHFGDPGKESNIIEVYIQKRLKGFCVIDTVEANEYVRKINGFYKGETNEEIASFILLRADEIDGDYKLLEKITAKEKSFVFNYKAELLSGDRHYFKVAAMSPDGDTAYSYPYYHFSLDQEPPGIPTDLKGIIDSNGVAKLSWSAPEDEDLKGYRVFRANSLKEEFIEKTTILELKTDFTDTLDLNNLTSEVYYYVRAVDNNYNNGDNTKPLLLMKPDTIPPVPPSFKAYEVRETGIYLKWANSGSSDVSKQYVIRQHNSINDTILKFYKEHDTLLDSSGDIGLKYDYFMVAEDKSGNYSQSKLLPVAYEVGYRPGPKIIEAKANLDQNQIFISWEQPSLPIYSIQIYRKKNDGKYRLHQTIRENVNEFSDSSLTINNEYHYKIKIMYKGGISSKMSEEVSIIF
ncbi:hypothetical protein K6119_15665 [Paracrocinitomix mangrovi]|uniref:hypothetical protein n=1 Tax=Paracrocinitomix mangrovi TaxID=2862509 RepID=UPI001C8D2C2F|nr:hypothetical protein [Paracrocinitomix mangrovi]UKN01167.1 hypothetical protein K6119_15665 [Paracrocinitomix mangrovi]